MRTLTFAASDAALRALVVDWNDLLAAGRFDEALALYPHEAQDGPWTAGRLAAAIAGYGVPDIDPETLAELHDAFEVSAFAISPIAGRDDEAQVVARIEVDRTNLDGLDPAAYAGRVHFPAVPLNGQPSDLTARFLVRRVGDDRITLAFVGFDVM